MRLELTAKLRTALGLGAISLAGLSWSTQAAACGGLFCSAAQPVNQAAERIIFAQQGGKTTAAIEIQYEGPSEKFSWVLPVPGIPEVKLSSKQAMDRLQAQTNPRYRVNRSFADDCNFGSFDAGLGFADAGAAVDDESDAVTVVASGTTGPYAWVVIDIDQEANNPARQMLDWLENNEYDVTALGEELLGEYVADGMNFLAVRLSKSESAGSVRPVLISYDSELPMIPIRPTAVAANPDMGVLTWVVGPSRAIPKNYRALELNDALIDWFNPNSNYNDVVIAAANEAGGHGFVTEYAAEAASLSERVYFSFEQEVRDQLEAASVRDLIEGAASSFGGWDGFEKVITDTVPLRDGVTVSEFLECVSCYFEPNLAADGGADAAPSEVLGDASTDPIFALDRDAFLEKLDDEVITPMKDTQALFDNGDYVTRMYTTLSADEMTKDPTFDFNADLGDVSNLHQIDLVSECTDGGERFTVTLPSGLIVSGADPFTWPVTGAADLPANLRILQYSTAGSGLVITDNSEVIALRLADMPLVPSTDGGPVDMPRPDAPKPGADHDSGPGGHINDNDAGLAEGAMAGGSGCNCRVGAPAERTPGASLAALGLGLAFARRMRRRAKS